MSRHTPVRLATKFVLTVGVKEYRETIADWVTPDDVVLEVGCEWGTTSTLLAPRCRELIATDISAECIERARREHPGIRFEVLDGFDVRAALDLARPFTKVYIDMSGISGYHSLLDAASLLMSYATVLRPRAVVLKSAALKRFAAHCVPWGMGRDASRSVVP
ncbi:MAG TPA: class I SAM-dependent methyltransferase [Planctomycetota bacterium]|nr:class I SAM-dependent methyltransferase [Planctomycetota bacterium]